MKYFQLFIVLLSSILIATAGCTSKNVEKEDSEVAELTGEESTDDSDTSTADELTAEDSGEAEGGESAFDESEDVASEEGGETESEELEEADDSGEIAELGEDEAGEESGATDELETGDAGTDELADSSSSTDDLGATSEDTTSSAPSTTDDSSLADSSSGGLSGDEMSGLSEEPAYRPVIPLKKMETTPYTKAGVLVNAIYVARDGDSLEGVSQKIYGMDKVNELKSVNGHVANRALKVGDKIYYNSPQRPTDNSQILTYYEDIGLTAEVYEVQGENENIRTISKQLLGNENSWKEVWATNLDVESKDVVPQGTRLRYWGSEVAKAAAPALAATQAPPPTQAPTPTFEEPPAPPPTEPPSSEVAQNDMGAEAPAMGSVEPPPPPPPSEMAPPPPPPVEAASDVAQNEEPAGGLDALAGGDEQMFLVVGGVLSLIGVVLMIIIIRKKRAKRGIDFQTATHTQIE